MRFATMMVDAGRLAERPDVRSPLIMKERD